VGLASSEKCEYGLVQTMSYIVNECPGSKLHDCDLQRLHSADDIAVKWLGGTVVKALVNDCRWLVVLRSLRLFTLHVAVSCSVAMSCTPSVQCGHCPTTNRAARFYCRGLSRTYWTTHTVYCTPPPSPSQPLARVAASSTYLLTFCFSFNSLKDFFDCRLLECGLC